MKKRKGRCVHCRRLFRPDPRLESRQRYCSSQECQTKRQRMNESQWLCKNPEVLAYKRSQTREWLKARPDYSRRRRQANPKLLESNRNGSRGRMREIRGERRFDKTKSILLQLLGNKADKCYLTRGARWLHLRLTNPSRYSNLKVLWENAGGLKTKTNPLPRGRVWDMSNKILNRPP